MRLPTGEALNGLQGFAEHLRSHGLDPKASKTLAWLDEVVATADRCVEWPVQNLTDCCGGSPAGGYEECLVSPLDARVRAVNIGGPAPGGCPLRNGGSVLLVGEPGA